MGLLVVFHSFVERVEAVSASQLGPRKGAFGISRGSKGENVEAMASRASRSFGLSLLVLCIRKRPFPFG